MQMIAKNGIEHTPSLEELLLILDMLPIPISCATLSDRRIRFHNKAFTRRFGHIAENITTIDDFIRSYTQEMQRGEIERLWSSLWNDAPVESGVEIIAETEIDIKSVNDTVITVALGGMILHAKDLSIAFFDDMPARDQMQKSILRHAYEDFLTGLANRRKLMMHWDQARGSTREANVAFLMLDMDRFKHVNDQLGHDAGDEVLRVVAKRLLSCVRESDLVCRFGGDEFGILLAESVDDAQVGHICDRVLEVVKAPMLIGGSEVCISTSIGASRVPDHGDTFDEIFKAADEALYLCKLNGRGCWRWADVGENLAAEG